MQSLQLIFTAMMVVGAVLFVVGNYQKGQDRSRERLRCEQKSERKATKEKSLEKIDMKEILAVTPKRDTDAQGRPLSPSVQAVIREMDANLIAASRKSKD